MDRYYVGSTPIRIGDRLARHNDGYYEGAWTRHGVPWTLFLTIVCESMSQARALEAHIKQMKSRTYIQNLKLYPEIIDKLKSRYPA
jgi:putative endonuclease